MTTDYQPTAPLAAPPPAPPTPEKTRRRWPWVLGIVAAFSMGIGVGAVANTDTNDTASGSPDTVATSAPATADATDNSAVEDTPVEPPEPTFVEPAMADFALTPKILEKSNYGSAGSSITFRVEVAYDGDAATFDPSKTYELTYEVRGGEAGPAINTLTFTGDQFSTDEEEYIDTPSTSTKVTIAVTDLSEL